MVLLRDEGREENQRGDAQEAQHKQSQGAHSIAGLSRLVEGAYTRMIAKVRIAPVERWCEELRRKQRGGEIAGREVQIDTDSMIQGSALFAACNGKQWFLTPESQAEIDMIVWGYPWNQPAYWCEHSLEMD